MAGDHSPLCHANSLQESAQLQPTVDRDWQEGSAVQQSWYLNDGEILTISDSSIRSSAQLNLDSYQINDDLPQPVVVPPYWSQLQSVLAKCLLSPSRQNTSSGHSVDSIASARE